MSSGEDHSGPPAVSDGIRVAGPARLVAPPVLWDPVAVLADAASVLALPAPFSVPEPMEITVTSP